ncbi:MAG TPA: hypothetical protein VGC41_08310, partial [Kofleriaceae bacterium]
MLDEATRPSPPAALLWICSGVVAAFALVVVAVLVIRQPHKKERPDRPVPWGAFAIGGVPHYDKGLDQLLGDDLIQFVIETNDHKATPEHEAQLRKAEAILARGPALVRTWTALLDAIDAWPLASSQKQRHTAEARLRSAAQHVDDQLATLGIGYHLEATTLPNMDEAVLAFRVEEVVFVHAGGEPRRVLSLRRIDAVNLEHSALGMQTEELGDPVVLLDQVDDFVADHVVPAVQNGVYFAGDANFMGTTLG